MNHILIDSSDALITTVTLNRPEKRNALSIELMEQLRAVHDASAESTRRVLIIRGAGTVFCAGLDLLEASDFQNTGRSSRALASLYESIATSPLVTIAAAQGAAMGGGVGLLAACDFAVGADDLRIGFPEVRRGLVAALITALLYRQLPQRILRELTLLGQTIDSSRAMSLGLLNRVVPAEGLADESHNLAKQATAGAPGAIARTKLLMDALDSRPVADALDRALQYHLAGRDASEAAEGIAAFLEKREPRWGPRNGPPG